MLLFITKIIELREHVADMTNKGQTTAPVDVCKHLELDKHRKVAVVVKPDDSVQLTMLKYPTLESVGGAVPPLSKPMALSEMRMVIADELAEAYRSKNP